MAGLISNLIIVLVFASSLGKCDFVQKPAEETSSPETTNLEVTGLSEEMFFPIAVTLGSVQIAATLSFLHKTIFETTEKRKKKNDRFSKKKARFAKKSARISPQDSEEQKFIQQAAYIIQFGEDLGNFAKTIQDKVSLNIENVATSDPRATRYNSNSDFVARANSTRRRIMGMIPAEIKNVETKVAETNRRKLILAFWNFAGMVFGALAAVGKEMKLQNEFKNLQENWKEDLGFGTDKDWSFYKWNEGNTIQFFAQLSYGYGYWGRYAIEMDESKVQCGLLDFVRVLDEYSRVVKYEKGSFDITVGAHFTKELKVKIRESLYCLISNPTYPKNKVKSELDGYVKIYTQILFDIIKNVEGAPVTLHV